MKRLTILFLMLLSISAVAQRGKIQSRMYSKLDKDTLYSFEPYYFVLVNEKHELEHYRTDSLLILRTEYRKWYSDDNKSWWSSMVERTIETGEKFYYYNYKRIYPVKLESLSQNVVWSGRHMATLKHKLTN